MSATREPAFLFDSNPSQHRCPTFAQVVVQAGAPHLAQPFTYCVPEGVSVEVGDCVLAPFGSRELIGYVVGLSDDVEVELLDKVKEITAKIENAAGFDAELWRVAQWVREQTLCDAESAVRLVSPVIAAARLRTRIRLIDAGARIAPEALPGESAQVVAQLQGAPGHTLLQSELGQGKVKQAEIGRALSALRRRGIIAREIGVDAPATREKTVRLVRLSVDADVAAAEAARLEKRSAKQAKLLRELAAGAAMSAGASIPEAGRVVEADLRPAAQALADKGLLTYHEMVVHRDPFGVRSLIKSNAPALTDEQAAAAKAVGAAMDEGKFTSFLLFGVTGSGKTEVYMDAIARALGHGCAAILLVPEISLSAQVMDVMKARFGNQVAVLHSALSSGEQFDEWQRIRRGEARLVVGARSAVFAPVPKLGLVIVDEEHDGAYKQDVMPRYNARDVALFRARQSGAVCILGSATPSIETYHRARVGVHHLLTLERRVHTRPLPPVETLDLRNASPMRSPMSPSSLPPEVRGILTEPMLEAIDKRLVKREQIILFLNRRGFAQFLLCRDCGFTFRCPNCAVSLTYHRGPGILQCHHCDFQRPAPHNCPKCNGINLKPFGIGTEKVEEAVQVAFPNARTLRMDRDTTAKKGAHGEILRAFKRHEADILIGTQMVAKGLDFANVTLVGVINADTALNMPDFRASERAFQLLMQVSGRAGRGAADGEVMVQTFNPEHDSIRLAAAHDYQSFYEIEIANRRELRYPPFASLANIVSSDEQENKAIERAHAIVRAIKDVAGRPGFPAPESVGILGPVACPLERLRNKYRWHLMVRCQSRPQLLSLLKGVLAIMPPADQQGLTLDIDPLSMM